MYGCFSVGVGGGLGFVSKSDYFIILFTKNCWQYYLQISKAKKGKDKSHSKIIFPVKIKKHITGKSNIHFLNARIYQIILKKLIKKKRKKKNG